MPLRGELYPIECKHFVPIKTQDLRLIERINQIIVKHGETIEPPDQETSLLKQLLAFLLNESAYHELGNSHYHVVVNKNGEIVAFFAKAELPNVFHHILRFSNLKALSIQLGKVVFDDLEEMLAMRPIEFLHIESKNTVFSDNLRIGNLPYLKHLSIQFTSTQELTIHRLNYLTFLSVDGVSLNLHEQPCLKALCIKGSYNFSINNPKKFKSLEIVRIKEAYDQSENAWLAELPNLKELYLDNSMISQQTIQQLSLQILSLTNICLPTLSIPIEMPLKHLIARGCRIKQIENLPPSLETIDLTDNQIEKLPSLMGFNNLQIFSLQDNKIRDDLGDFYLPPNLRMLNLQGNPISSLNPKFVEQIQNVPVVLLPVLFTNEVVIPTERV